MSNKVNLFFVSQLPFVLLSAAVATMILLNSGIHAEIVFALSRMFSNLAQWTAAILLILTMVQEHSIQNDSATMAFMFSVAWNSMIDFEIAMMAV